MFFIVHVNIYRYIDMDRVSLEHDENIVLSIA